ncbi:MAG TPA: glutamyl-tRNA reductase [Gemmatimonadaceae bacterium]|nr:glutamyl-tRNA reductase [Gemmatimonadaceae bacterium]
MAVIVLGVSHHTAPIEVRERIAVPPHEVRETVLALREASAAREVVLLSTCNRTEVYLVEGEGEAVPAVWSRLSARLGRDVSAHGYVRRDREAVAHLFRVASGMDSMILGEAQIHGQVRDAWELSRAASRAVLNRLFQTALAVASRVRTETAIARGAASVSSAAVQLAKKIFGSLQGRRAMVLGAGDMADLALECLVSEGVRTAIVANRTFERAQELAARHGAVALHYDQCWERLHEVDVLLCSTAAPHAIVERAHVERTLRVRGDRPLCILDIALPRDVDAAVGSLDNVFLYDLDDLQAVVAANLERRREELPSAEQVIAAEVDGYWNWLAGLAAVPVLKTFRSQMDRVREDELARALRKLGHLAPDDRQAVEHFSRALMNKFLHEPSVRLRAASANGHGLAIVDALRYLFALEADGTTDDAAGPAATDEER